MTKMYFSAPKFLNKFPPTKRWVETVNRRYNNIFKVHDKAYGRNGYTPKSRKSSLGMENVKLEQHNRWEADWHMLLSLKGDNEHLPTPMSWFERNLIWLYCRVVFCDIWSKAWVEPKKKR